MSARAESARYSSRPTARKVEAARPCRGCGAPIQFIKSPKSGKQQACDVDEKVLVLPSGEVVRGYFSHWNTCKNPPARASAAPAAASPSSSSSGPTSRPPWKEPVSEPEGQLQLGASSKDPIEVAAERLARWTIQGWYDSSARSSMLEALRDPERKLRVSIDPVSGYQDVTGPAIAAHDRDRLRFNALLALRVDEIVVFVVLDEKRTSDPSNMRQGIKAELRINGELLKRLGLEDK